MFLVWLTQAVLVALNYQHIRVPETNYRCAVLGLYAAMERSRANKISKWTLSRSKKASRGGGADMATATGIIPVEAAPLFLLSRGLSLTALYQNEALLKELGLGRFRGSAGALRSECIPVQRLLEVAHTSGTSPSTWPWFGWPLRGLHYTAECRRVAKALLVQGPEVDGQGASFLSEIVTGVSSFGTSAL
jgi:hypothetical protein